MHISKQSLFYRFLNTNWFTCDDRAPANLCPFMRKVLGSIIVNFIVAGAVAWFALCIIFAPLMWLGVSLSELQEVMGILGSVLWFVASGFFAAMGVSRLNQVSRATQRVVAMNSYQTTASWIVAMHNKVCPWIDYK